MTPAPVSCVISTWNRASDVVANVAALLQQTRPPAEIIVVDNHSDDDTVQRLRRFDPAVVKVQVMPHSRAGACETFNRGFRAATQEFVAILDDDVVLPPTWIERLLERFGREPATTALITTKVVEPGMPDEYLRRPDNNTEAWLCTFRGCGSLGRREVLERAGWYDERFFIYGNERDLAARILNLGHRILLLPDVITFHGTPFGMKSGTRSLYYHVRNFWLYAYKHCAWTTVAGVGLRLGLRALFGSGGGGAAEATGTIGLERAVKETPRGVWVAFRATLASLAHLPYCLRRRQVCRAPDFRPPLG